MASPKLFWFHFIILLLSSQNVHGQWDPHYVDGRTTMVHLFEWRWEDIAQECERFLGPNGYGGVQVSPPNENKIVDGRPWWERYQPMSYKLETRSGSETEFQSMVSRCNAVGVRIYVDVVVNHMTGGDSGVGTGGSTNDGYNYPGVPFSALDFNVPLGYCPSASGDIEDYTDPIQIRNCEFLSLHDLHGGSEYVRGRILEYMNRLVSYGVAGFRFDLAKHIWPSDLHTIVGRLNNLNTQHGFPSEARPFIFQEVRDLGRCLLQNNALSGEVIGADQYLEIGTITEFRVGRDLGNIFRQWNGQKLSFARNFGSDWGMIQDGSAFVFVDNHDTQRGGGGGDESVLTYKVSRLYKMAIAFMLAWPYGKTRVISSFQFDDFDAGPPANGDAILPVPINPDMSCGNGWVCEHRWRQISNMVQFRNAVGNTPVANWWSNNENQIAFSRGNRGFIAINNDPFDLSRTFQTGLPQGSYCDVISGLLLNGSCTGKTIAVNADGSATFTIGSSDEDPVVALHVNAKQ